MAGQKSGLSARPAMRAAQALTRRVLPKQLATVVEHAIGVKVALGVLAVGLPILLVVTMIVGLVGVIAGEAQAEGCLGGVSSNGAAPVGLSGPPKELIPIYQKASTEVGLNPEGPAILAAINLVETDFGKNLGPSSAGAIGWMQFEPSTWTIYGNGGDPDDPHDAIFAAARLLKANGAPGNWDLAIFAYNHATWYVEEVEADARKFTADVPPSRTPEGGAEAEGEEEVEEGALEVAEGGSAGGIELAACVSAESSETPVPGGSAKLRSDGLVSPPAEAPQQVKSMITAANQIAGLPYVFGGHHQLGSAVNGYDCSSAASYVMLAGGLLPAGTAGFQEGDFWTSFVAADFEPGGSVGLVSGPGKWVTLYTNGGEHVYMMIAGVRFDDSSHLRNGAGPNGTNVSMWQKPIALPGFFTSHPVGF